MIDASMTNTLQQAEGKINVETIEKMFSSIVQLSIFRRCAILKRC
jgi:chorismate-pyruvate lyase